MKRRRIIQLLICCTLGMGLGNSLVLLAIAPNIFQAIVAIITIIAMVLNILSYNKDEKQNENKEYDK